MSVLLEGDKDALAILASFLVYAEDENPCMMFASHTATDAVEALAHFMKVPVHKLRQRMLAP